MSNFENNNNYQENYNVRTESYRIFPDSYPWKSDYESSFNEITWKYRVISETRWEIGDLKSEIGETFVRSEPDRGFDFQIRTPNDNITPSLDWKDDWYTAWIWTEIEYWGYYWWINMDIYTRNPTYTDRDTWESFKYDYDGESSRVDILNFYAWRVFNLYEDSKTQFDLKIWWWIEAEWNFWWQDKIQNPWHEISQTSDFDVTADYDEWRIWVYSETNLQALMSISENFYVWADAYAKLWTLSSSFDAKSFSWISFWGLNIEAAVWYSNLDTDSDTINYGANKGLYNEFEVSYEFENWLKPYVWFKWYTQDQDAPNDWYWTVWVSYSF